SQTSLPFCAIPFSFESVSPFVLDSSASPLVLDSFFCSSTLVSWGLASALSSFEALDSSDLEFSTELDTLSSVFCVSPSAFFSSGLFSSFESIGLASADLSFPSEFAEELLSTALASDLAFSVDAVTALSPDSEFVTLLSLDSFSATFDSISITVSLLLSAEAATSFELAESKKSIVDSQMNTEDLLLIKPGKD
ncbi:hypothetical protein C0J52_28312, partial [Blattella germanica]